MTTATTVGLVAAGVALVLAGCGTPDPAATASDACAEPEFPTRQEGSHLIGDTPPPLPYSSNPPTSGWHRSGTARLGIVDEPLSGPELVSALERGHVVVALDPDRVEEDDLATLTVLALGTYDGVLTVTAWPDQPTALSLVGWGVLQRCDDFDEQVLGEFVSQHAGDDQHG